MEPATLNIEVTREIGATLALLVITVAGMIIKLIPHLTALGTAKLRLKLDIMRYEQEAIRIQQMENTAKLERLLSTNLPEEDTP